MGEAMNFSIDTYEYEETPETQIAGVRSKVEGGVQRLDYLENVYKQKQIGVMNRIRNLRWACVAWLAISLAWLGFGLFIYVMTRNSAYGYAFAFTSIGACYLASALFLVGTLRVFLSYCTHEMKVSAPVRLIYNRRAKNYTLQDMQTYGIYTLKEEGEDCKKLIAQVVENRKILQNYLNSPKSTAEKGEELLNGMTTMLEENDRRATILYGERM